MSKERTDEGFYRLERMWLIGFWIVAIPLWVATAILRHHTAVAEWLLIFALVATGLGVALKCIMGIEGKLLPEEQERR